MGTRTFTKVWGLTGGAVAVTALVASGPLAARLWTRRRQDAQLARSNATIERLDLLIGQEVAKQDVLRRERARLLSAEIEDLAAIDSPGELGWA